MGLERRELGVERRRRRHVDRVGVEGNAGRLHDGLAHHRVPRLVPQLTGEVTSPVPRARPGGVEDRPHPLGHVHLPQPLAGQCKGALAGRRGVVGVDLVDLGGGVEGIREALVAPRPRVELVLGAVPAWWRQGHRRRKLGDTEHAARGCQVAADVRGKRLQLRRRRRVPGHCQPRGVAPRDGLLLLPPDDAEDPRGGVIEQRVHLVELTPDGRHELGPQHRVDAAQQLRRTVRPQCLLHHGLEPRVRRLVEVQRRIAQLGDPSPERGRVLGVEPEVQAERALHLPLGRAGEVRGGDVRQPPVHVGEALQADDRHVDRDPRLGGAGVRADAGQGRQPRVGGIEWHGLGSFLGP